MSEIGFTLTTEGTEVSSENNVHLAGQNTNEKNKELKRVTAATETEADPQEPQPKRSKTTLTAAELRKKTRDEERETKKIKKLQEEERKRDEKRLKKQEELERRQRKKEQDELERKQKREAIEAEKQAKKDLKEKERLEKIRKREDEQKNKEEKKRIEEEQKQQKKEEAEKKKQEEAEKKEQEEKERKQKRSITNFFKVKLSDSANASMISLSPSKEPSKEYPIIQEESEFDQFFLPFYINTEVTVATNFNKARSSKWDAFIKNPTSLTYKTPIRTKPLNQEKYPTANHILQLMNSGMDNDVNSQFKLLPIRYLRFYENRKPPFYGTFTKPINEEVLTAPFLKIDSIDYDVDSDYSECEEDEGEDVDMEDEDEEEDDEDDADEDIDTFVESDDNFNSTNKKSIMGPLVPLVRNIKDDAHETDNQNDEFSGYFQGLQWKTVRDDIKFPLDPFKNYWGGSKVVENKTIAAPVSETEVKPSNPVVGPMLVKKRVISDEKALSALCEFIKSNGTLTINTMAELASKNVIELSKISRSLVKNSIREVARFNKKSSKWEIV